MNERLAIYFLDGNSDLSVLYLNIFRRNEDVSVQITKATFTSHIKKCLV